MDHGGTVEAANEFLELRTMVRENARLRQFMSLQAPIKSARQSIGPLPWRRAPCTRTYLDTQAGYMQV